MEMLLSALRAAGEPTRLRILAILARGELTVSELTQVLLQSQPRISRHLKLLADAKLVQRHPEGSWVFYRLNDSQDIAGLLQQLITHLPADDLTLQRDYERFEHVCEERAARARHYFAANAAAWDDLRTHHIPETEVEGKIATSIGERQIDLLVDLGTGTGRMLEIFAPRCARAIGFDISPEMLTIARSKLDSSALDHCQVRQGDCANVPLEDGVADIVILHQVLHFLDDPAQAIAEAARILAPGGSVLIADFGPHDMENLREQHAHRRLGFSSEEIQSMLAQSGLHYFAGETLTSHNHDLPVALWRADKLAAAF
jgi:SAM-dependent methyltransferase/DNA-binding MarR family transcriptional regulator